MKKQIECGRLHSHGLRPGVACLALWGLCAQAGAAAGPPTVLYVDVDAEPGGDGTTWATAFVDLTDALSAAAGSSGQVNQIWVAAGVYKPDRATGDRSASFHLGNGLALYGGFAGGETDLAERDVSLNLTTLSGDLGVPGDTSDNSFHVVVADLNDETAVLDGFTITGGNADGVDPDDGGGGIRVYGGGSPTFRDCTVTLNTAARFGAGAYLFVNNRSTFEGCTFSSNVVTGTTWPEGGGGLYAYAECDPVLTDCVFRANSATYGAGMAILFNCEPVLTSCTFEGNTGPIESQGANQGAGLYAYSFCQPALQRCVISDNTAGFGGGMASLLESTATLDDCIIRNNDAVGSGGGLYTSSSSFVGLYDCLIAGNTATLGGGLMNVDNSNTGLVNCTVVGNSAIFGGGLYISDSAAAVSNSILWSNTSSGVMDEPAQIGVSGSAALVGFSTVQGWTGMFGGVENNGTDPLMRDPDGPDDVFGTSDDDPRLQAGSPAIDTGDSAAVPPGVVTDLDGRPRVFNAIVDRGAYEFIPAIPGDLDQNGTVDLDDVSAFAGCMAGPDVTTPPPGCDPEQFQRADLDGDADADLADFAPLSANLTDSGS